MDLVIVRKQKGTRSWEEEHIGGVKDEGGYDLTMYIYEILKKKELRQTWWPRPSGPALRRQRQEALCELKASQGCVMFQKRKRGRRKIKNIALPNKQIKGHQEFKASLSYTCWRLT